MSDTSHAPRTSGGPSAASAPDDLVTRLDAASRGTLAERLGIVIEEAAPDRVQGSMPVAGNTQPAGLLHGGASAALAETLGSYAATLHAGPERSIVGIELSASHHRGARTGRVHGLATALHLGRTTASYEIVVRDDEGRRVCTARLTCLLLDPGARSGS